MKNQSMATDERQQANATLGSVSDLSSYLANPTNLEKMYATLNERQRLIAALIDIVQSQRGLPTIDDIGRLIRIRDWEPILEDVPTYSIAYCFKQAVKQHLDDRPFGAPDVLRVWVQSAETTREEIRSKFAPPALPQGPPCNYCDGGGWKYLDCDATDVAWKDRGKGVTV